VLAPADISDESVIIQNNPFAAALDCNEVGVRIAQPGLIRFCCRGIRDDWPIWLSVRTGGVVIVFRSNDSDVFALEHSLKTIERSACVTETLANGRRIGVLRDRWHAILIDELISKPRV